MCFALASSKTSCFRSMLIRDCSSAWFYTEWYITQNPFSVSQQPLIGQGVIIVEASWSHTITLHSVELLWTSDQPDTETSIWQPTTSTGDRRIHAPGVFRSRSPRPAPQTSRPRGSAKQNIGDIYFKFCPKWLFTPKLLGWSLVSST
jgi:hypothetical protein